MRSKYDECLLPIYGEIRPRSCLPGNTSAIWGCPNLEIPASDDQRCYWYDHECRTKRSHAIAAGVRAQSASDRGKHLVACREYRACVQRKKRHFRHKNFRHVTQIFVRDKAKLWKALDRMSNTFRTKNGPDRDMFANHFESLSKSPSACHFNKEYERQALDFLKRYDSGELDMYMKQSLESQIVNENFTPNEIHRVIEVTCLGCEMLK